MVLAQLARLAQRAPASDLRDALMLFEEELVQRRIQARIDARPHRSHLLDEAAQRIAQARRLLDEASRGESCPPIVLHVPAPVDVDAEGQEGWSGRPRTLPAPLKGGQHGTAVLP